MRANMEYSQASLLLLKGVAKQRYGSPADIVIAGRYYDRKSHDGFNFLQTALLQVKVGTVMTF